MLNKERQAETEVDSEPMPIAPTSSPNAAKPNVIGCFVVPADYDEGPECEDDGCEFCNDIHCDGSCQEDDF